MDTRSEFPPRFLQAVGRPLRRDVLLREHSHFQIGGPADYFFEANGPAELKSALAVARAGGLAAYVIGGGSNLLFDDAGYRGLMVKYSCRDLGAEPDFILRAAAGVPLVEAVALAAGRGWEGLEFLAGIPGTVGGAVFGNAGAFGQCLGDVLEEASLARVDGQEFRAARDFFDFGYRHSRLKIHHDIVLEARVRLRPGRPAEINSKIAENLGVRASKHPPPETAYAGSYFKNPPAGPDGIKKSAGFYLENVGAKTLKSGGAEVFPGHCNFLINARQATAGDIRALAVELKRRVREAFGIELEEEVVFLPAESSML